MSITLPPLPPPATFALFAGTARQGSEIRLLADSYEPNCAQYTHYQMQAFARAAIAADRASRVPTAPEALLRALRFYAHGEHFIIDPDTFDTVSGEPQNWLVQDDDGGEMMGGAMIEDGHVAREALRGADLKALDEAGEEQQPITGEVFTAQLERVPMTDAQLRELVPDWIGHHLVKHFELPELMRAVEAHHGIGAKP